VSLRQNPSDLRLGFGCRNLALFTVHRFNNTNTFSINLVAGNTDASVVYSLCEINTSSKFFSWLYDLFFGGVPVAESVIDIPKDPPLPPSKY